MSADIGLVGLAVMGQNLIMNMNDHGFVVCAFNRTVSKVTDFLNGSAKGSNVIGAKSIDDLCGKLKKPRRVMLMVKAGQAVDDFIKQLLPHLEAGDIIIDGGNSEYVDTNRRCEYLGGKSLLFVGCGVSGGEEGARHGPSLMPGGHSAAWPHIKPIFQSIAAKVDGDEPCCDWVGDFGAGHFVKMVHNGIEYGDMQIICEAFHIMKDVLTMSQDEMADVFEEWNKGNLDSFLIEITAKILRYKENDEYLLPQIKDAAGQKGTGKWTGISALEFGVPLTLISESVFARCLSSYFDERQKAATILKCSNSANAPIKTKEERRLFLENLGKAVYAAKLISYTQGFVLLREAAKRFGWSVNFGSVALMWRGGCIIRSRFLGNIKDAFDSDPDLSNLLLNDFFSKTINHCEKSLRNVVSLAALSGVPVPCMSSGLSYYDSYRSKTLPANLVQAQRDFFGAHTYETLAKPGVFVHSDWAGTGGKVSSSTYQA